MVFSSFKELGSELVIFYRFEVVRVAGSSKEREALSQDSIKNIRATFVSADLVAEVAVDKAINNQVHGLRGEQLVD